MGNGTLAKAYDPSQVEAKWYPRWLEAGVFAPVARPQNGSDNDTPYVILLPPPNVTGVLHMGHMLNNTIQDILIRKARLDGKNACWVPGTDHASIATEAKVVLAVQEGLLDAHQPPDEIGEVVAAHEDVDAVPVLVHLQDKREAVPRRLEFILGRIGNLGRLLIPDMRIQGGHQHQHGEDAQ